MAKFSKDSDPAVVISDLSLGYAGKGLSQAFRALEGVSLNVDKGGSLAVLGESGSGKSTLLKYLAGRAKTAAAAPSHIKTIAGEAYTLGAPLHRLKRDYQNKLSVFAGYLPQDAGAKLSPELNIGDLIFQPIEERLKNFDRAELGAQIAEYFDDMAMPLTFLQKFPYELSKGQRQRVAVIRALITEPVVLFLDEPTLGVDANNRPRIVEVLKKFRQRTGSTLLVISHDISILEALVNRVLVLQQGTPVGYGHINDIFRQAESGYVYQLASALRATAYDEVAHEQ